jgi:hypothetical protein
MMNNLGEIVLMPDQEFKQAMVERRAKLHLTEGRTIIGCPLCGTAKADGATTAGNQQ